MTTNSDWVEQKATALIAQIKRSQFAKDCFSDAKVFTAQGYGLYVALSIAWNYWK